MSRIVVVYIVTSALLSRDLLEALVHFTAVKYLAHMVVICFEEVHFMKFMKFIVLSFYV